jgi:hypothetical protein
VFSLVIPPFFSNLSFQASSYPVEPEGTWMVSVTVLLTFVNIFPFANVGAALPMVMVTAAFSLNASRKAEALMLLIPGIFTVVRLAHNSKVLDSMTVSPCRFTVVKALQYAKVDIPMVVSFGKFTVVRALQLLKAYMAMVSTFGIFTMVRALQPSKALISIDVAFGKFTEVKAG